MTVNFRRTLLQPWQTLSSWSSLCAQENRHAGTCSETLIPVERNLSLQYAETFYTIVWQRLQKGPRMGVLILLAIQRLQFPVSCFCGFIDLLLFLFVGLIFSLFYKSNCNCFKGFFLQTAALVRVDCNQVQLHFKKAYLLIFFHNDQIGATDLLKFLNLLLTHNSVIDGQNFHRLFTV